MMKKFKYYKSKDKLPSLDDVIDCSENNKHAVDKFTIDINKEIPNIGLKDLSDWNIYSLKDCPGLIIIKNPFTSLGQRYYIKKLLKDYTKNHPNNLLESRFKENVIKDFWTSWTEEVDQQQKNLIKKSMRWTTLGYHYDWTNKVYNEENKDEFPEELSRLVSVFAEVLNFNNFISEAAIINFYHIGSTLSAHTDHSEICHAPLFSISFGQSAVFLMGGSFKDADAVPILLNSGDVVIMSGRSRLNYHAVPRIFESESQTWNENDDTKNCSVLNPDDLKECISKESWKQFEKYLMDSRINVNVRQYKNKI
ncbi:nucleic acid dioxygenase ALKBH1 [Chironomus tepperi]|uniref:nucleic acid dioxygenase ALKBH1 n=1 Tax=Chironomus tepperi TaxID=113505 RepID=UPI00391F4424